MRVADVGCGSGYGTRILRRTASAVTGVDNDEPTIETARTTVGREEDVSFELADATDFIRRDLADHFDAVVMLETLEHLAEPGEALASLREHASRGLRIVLSIPNSKWLEEDNPYHETAFGYEEAIQALKGFDDCTLLYQFLAEGSLIRAARSLRAGRPSCRDRARRA